MLKQMMEGVKAVFFDAGGTLLYPYPSVGEIYGRAAAKYGSTATADQIQDSFLKVWHRRHGIGALAGQVSEKKERQVWRSIVLEVFEPLGGVPDFESFFEELYRLFAGPGSWRLYPETLTVLTELRSRGKRLAIISNWDSRLHQLCETMELRPHFELILASAVFGASKPRPKIFQRALEKMGVQAHEAVHIGDSFQDDVRGARQAGLHAIWLDRHGLVDHPDTPDLSETLPVITSLENIIT